MAFTREKMSTLHTNNSSDNAPQKKTAWWLRNKTTLLALLGILATTPGCDSDNTPKFSDQAGKLSNLIELTIQESNPQEMSAYKELLEHNTRTQQILVDMLSKHSKVEKTFGNILSFEEVLPIIIKESRLHSDAKSRTWAQWYWQLKPDAIKDVNTLLKKAWINTKEFSPTSNATHNLLYTYLYFSHQRNQINKYVDETDGDKLDQNEAILFAASAYNMGLNKWKHLYKDAGKPSSRDDFAEYITKELMKVSDGPTSEIDPYYGVENYTNRFGKWSSTKYTNNKSPIFQEDNIVLTMEKAFEVIRYVEIIHALQGQLAKKAVVYDEINHDGEKMAPYSTVKQYVEQKVNDGTCKAWANGQLINRILLDNGITDLTDGKSLETITVAESIIKPFLVDESFKKYSYEAKEYSNQDRIYLWAIVNKSLEDRDFIQSLEIFNDDIETNGREESEGVIRQYLLEAIIRFNQERRSGWTENASRDVWMPEPKYFSEYNNLKNTPSAEQAEAWTQIISDVEHISSGHNYASANLDKLGEQIKEWPTSFKVVKAWNRHIRRALNKHGSKKPTMIVIHGTESGDIKESNASSLAGINAHFYISREGQIYQFISDEKALISNTEITYPNEITSLNHAWVGLTNSYGLSWEGDQNLTYSAIGIEVECGANNGACNAQNKALAMLLAGLSTKYHIKQKNIVTHAQVAASKAYGRGRKSDLLGVDRKALGLINNYDRLDQDVIDGKVSPNMLQMVRTLTQRGKGKREIKKILNGLNMSIKKHREKVQQNPSTPTHNKADINAWLTLEELERKGLF